MLYAACFVVIAYLVGARGSEILRLKAGCVKRRDPGYDSMTVIVGAIFKKQPEYHGRPHEWVAPAPAIRAIGVLEALSEGHRRRAGQDDLWLRRWRTSGARAWKHKVQQFADDTRMRIHVSHFPPGTSKWNKIEHRVFCHITQNWRGKPLRTFETIVDLIGNTRTDAGLRVRAELDKRKYPTGVTATDAEMDALSLHRNQFHGDWNYEVHPR